MSGDVLWSGSTPVWSDTEVWSLHYTITYDQEGKARLSSVPYWTCAEASDVA